MALCILMFISTALNTAFGSLYCDEVMVSPVKVVPLLAAANLLQLVSTMCNPHFKLFESQDVTNIKKKNFLQQYQYIIK